MAGARGEQRRKSGVGGGGSHACWPGGADTICAAGRAGINSAVAARTATEARADELAKSIMALNVKTHHLGKFRLHPTARGVWEALAAEFLSERYTSKLRKEMFFLRRGRNESMTRYVNRGRTLAWKLREMGVVLDDQKLATRPSKMGPMLPKFELTTHAIVLERDVTVSLVLKRLQAAERGLRADCYC